MAEFQFRPFDDKTDLELVLGWLLDTKQAAGMPVDAELERKSYFEFVRSIQSRNTSYSSILLCSGKPVGYLCTFPMEKHPGSSWLDFCYLIPEARGTEASGEFVRRIVETALENGCRDVYLNVHRNNVRGIGFYEKNGWELDEKKPDGLNRMKKTLASAKLSPR